MIYARSHRTIIDSWFLHCFEDTKANYSPMPSDLKIRHLRSICSACSATYSNDRVVLSVTPSALPLSLSVSLGFNEY